LPPLKILVPLGLAVALAACASSGPEATPTAGTSAAIPMTAASPSTTATAGAGATKVAAPGPAGSLPGVTVSEGDYRVSPMDVLDISVFQVPDLSKTVQVSASGQINLPLIGTVAVSQKTTAEVEREIAAKLGENYLQSPQVSVYVKEYTSQRITVDGAVLKPGIYPMNGSTTLIQAVALAGGLDRVADPHGIVVFRQQNGKRLAAVFDLTAIRAGKNDDPTIQGGDVVVVDQSGIKAALRGVRESVGMMGLFTPFL
jgi:polysaccharide export outer membrane protein